MRPHRRQPTRLPRPWDSPGKNTGLGCHFLLQCMKVKSESEIAQSCPTLSDTMDCSLPGSSINGIFQARVLEWGAIAFSAMQETRILFLGREVPLEKGMAIHSSILTWRIPWTEKPGGLQSVGSQKVGHDWTTNIHTHIGLPRWLSGKESACQCRRYRRCGFDPWVGKSPWRRKWQPIPVFLPGKIPWTEEPGRLQSMGLQRVGHDWANERTRMRAPYSTENCIQYPMRNRIGKECFVSFFSYPFHQHPTCCPFWQCLNALPLHPYPTITSTVAWQQRWSLPLSAVTLPSLNLLPKMVTVTF